MVDRIDWYYAERAGQPTGPLAREALVEAARSAKLTIATLIWRTGWPQWRAFGECAREIGLGEFAPAGPPGPPAYVPTPAGVGGAAPTAVVYAGFLRRFGALILDNLILTIPLVVAGGGLGIALSTGSGEAGTGIAAAQGVYYLLWLVAAPLYYALQESSAHQATLGKRALGIKVTDLDGRRIDFGRAIGRWFAAALSYLTFYVGFIMAGFTERKQALHDFVAGTLVVDRWAYTDHPERQQHGASGCLIAILIAVSMVPVAGILAAIALPAYQDYVLRAHVATAIAEANPLKETVARALAENGSCPVNGEAGIEAPDRYASGSVATIEVRPGDGVCLIEIVLADANAKLGGKHVRLSLQHAEMPWSCSSDVEWRLLPPSCRE